MNLFKEESIGPVMVIGCPANLDLHASKVFSEQVKTWIQYPTAQYIMDFGHVLKMSSDFFIAVVQFKAALKREQKMLYSYNVNAGLQERVKAQGLWDAFNPIKSIEDVLPKPKPAPKVKSAQVNVELINPFLTSTQKALDVQCQMKVKPLKPFLKSEKLANIEIAGLIALQSQGFRGTLVLNFPAKVFCKVYENMVGERHETITEDMTDGAAEVLNIIYGLAKADLNAKGFEFPPAIPEVLTGEKLSARQAEVKPAVVVPFETEVGPFHIEIEFSNTEEAA